jgi:hypothetical protein
MLYGSTNQWTARNRKSENSLHIPRLRNYESAWFLYMLNIVLNKTDNLIFMYYQTWVNFLTWTSKQQPWGTQKFTFFCTLRQLYWKEGGDNCSMRSIIFRHSLVMKRQGRIDQLWNEYSNSSYKQCNRRPMRIYFFVYISIILRRPSYIIQWLELLPLSFNNKIKIYYCTSLCDMNKLQH